jgi:N6-adenosine-specific RNA methylase IME4
MTFKTILADPPGALRVQKSGYAKHKMKAALDYPTMSLADICALPVAELAEPDCHLWLWTCNGFLEQGFQVMRSWGFKYLAPIHWIKPSGIGNWFVHRTQTILFGYKEKCKFPLRRYLPNIFETSCPKRHSQKPLESYALVESVSPGPRIELFARTVRPGWRVWGNEVTSCPEFFDLKF